MRFLVIMHNQRSNRKNFTMFIIFYCFLFGYLKKVCTFATV